MKILIVHRYFYPDSPTYAFLLYKLAKSYKEYFDKVSVLTSMPSYYGSNTLQNIPRKEYIDGVKVKRLRLLPEHGRNFYWRAVNSLLFGLAVFFHILINGKRYDVIQVATTPPIVSAMAVALASKIRGIRFVYHCQDIYPDITHTGKEKLKMGLAYKLAFGLDKFIMQNAWKIVVLSGDMKRHIIATRNLKSSNVTVINNFNFNRNSTSSTGDIPQELIPVLNSNCKKIVFAGNLGYFQNLEIIFDVVDRIVREYNVVLIVIGDGVKRRELAAKYSSNSIIFTGFLPNEIVQRVYTYCHLGLAPVIAGIEKVAYPSKIISYTLSGLPVLTFSSAGSLIEKFIIENGMGNNYAFDGEEALASSILGILHQDYEKARLKEKASIEFGEELAYNKWKRLYQEAEID